MENTGTSQTVIAPDMEITGTVKTSGSIQINGKLEGDLHSEGDATIGKDAQIKGNLSVNSISVSGSVTGNITARDRIQLQATARVNGDIKAKRLAVEDGVSFVGKSEVNPSGSPAASAPARSESSAIGGAKDDAKSGLYGKK